MSYQGQNPNPDQYPNSGEYGRGYTPQPSDPYAGNEYYQPSNNPSTGNQYNQPGNTQQSGTQYNQPGTGSQYQQQPNYGQSPYNQQQYNAPMGSSTFTTLGIDPRIEAVLCYVLGWVTGLIFFFLEKQNRQVRFHAMQSILFFGSLNILMIIIGAIPFINLLSPLLVLVWIAGVITLAIIAYTNNPYRIPYLSDYADRYTDQIKI